MSKWLFPDDMEGVDPSHPVFDCIVLNASWLKPGDKVYTPVFPNNTFIVGVDNSLALETPFEPGDCAQFSPSEWYVLGEDGRTWKPIKGETEQDSITALAEIQNANDALDYYGAPSAKECACGWSWSLACRIEALLEELTPDQLAKIQALIKAKPIIEVYLAFENRTSELRKRLK